MNRISILLIAAATLLSLQTLAWSEALQAGSVVIEANTIEVSPPIVHASGHVLMTLGDKRLTADEVVYNRDRNNGRMANVSFTTCDLDNPHYHISAKTILLMENGDITAERVGIYFSGRRILSLPRLHTKLQGSREQNYVPKPGYSSREGLFVALGYTLVQSDRANADLFIRPTTKLGLQVGLTGGYAVSGSRDSVGLYSQETDLDIRNRTMPVSRMLKGFSENIDETKPHQVLAVFGGLVVKEKFFDVDYPSLTATRLPEIGIRWSSSEFSAAEIGSGQTLPISVDLRTSWGRFDDSTTRHYLNRVDTRGVLGIRLTPKQRNTSIRMLIMGRYSRYEGGNSYGVVGSALEVSKFLGSNCIISSRLIDHKISGTTPFEFDDVDVRRELQSAIRLEKGRGTWAGIIRYDLDKDRIRDWELAYARRIHCLEPGVVWRNRFSEISFVLRIPGL